MCNHSSRLNGATAGDDAAERGFRSVGTSLLDARIVSWNSLCIEGMENLRMFNGNTSTPGLQLIVLKHCEHVL